MPRAPKRERTQSSRLSKWFSNQSFVMKYRASNDGRRLNPTIHTELHRLKPFLDEHGILRVGRRLVHAALHPRVKHPAVLPWDSHVSTLLIIYYHEQVHHQGERTDLRQERMETTRPFTYCGMDCSGPFYIKEGRKEPKRYGLLLTCSWAVPRTGEETREISELIISISCTEPIRFSRYNRMKGWPAQNEPISIWDKSSFPSQLQSSMIDPSLDCSK